MNEILKNLMQKQWFNAAQMGAITDALTEAHQAGYAAGHATAVDEFQYQEAEREAAEDEKKTNAEAIAEAGNPAEENDSQAY